MFNKTKALVLPILTITLGIGWLLTAQNVMPGVNWIWVLALGMIGLLTLAAGIDRVSFVTGSFLSSASIFSILRQTGRLSIDIEVPLLVIVFGTLMLLAKVLPLPHQNGCSIRRKVVKDRSKNASSGNERS